MVANGVGKRVELTAQGVRLTPTGLMGSKEVVEIPYESIVEIRSQAASLFSRGWLHFGTATSPSGAFSIPYTQPNAVIFKKSEQAAFDNLKTEVQERVSALKRGSHN